MTYRPVGGCAADLLARKMPDSPYDRPHGRSDPEGATDVQVIIGHSDPEGVTDIKNTAPTGISDPEGVTDVSIIARNTLTDLS
jgi:hypothetical protein